MKDIVNKRQEGKKDKTKQKDNDKKTKPAKNKAHPLRILSAVLCLLYVTSNSPTTSRS